jgi:DNA-binding NarL/FixJ family response regulator
VHSRNRDQIHADEHRRLIRIVIVENQHIIADALESLLSRQPGMEVIGKMSSLEGVPPWVMEMNPDVAILGYRLHDELAAAAAHAINATTSEAKMIFLTADDGDKAVMAAIDAGASAVLHISVTSADLISAVRAVAIGATLISPQTIARMLRGRRNTDGMREQLTVREREVLILVAEGASNRAIATVLGISYLTVRSHMRNLAGKLAAHSRLEVVVRAQQLELVSKLPTPTIWDDAEFAAVGASSN